MRRALLALGLGLGGVAAATPSFAETPQELLRSTCSGCHQPDSSGQLSRISQQRKTPEGWAMTIERMERLHGIVVSSQDLPMGSPDAKRALVKYLADTQGLGPAEAAGFRYALEQRLDDFEPVDADFKTMCGRCHSAARVLLQRRPVEEWRKLVHFHLGQYPSTEYSAGGRDRDWLAIALNETAPMLAQKYAYDGETWRKWRKAKKPDLSGTWVVQGHQPTKGDVEGTMYAAPLGGDTFEVDWDATYLDSAPRGVAATATEGDAPEAVEKLDGQGRAVVYTGYEWRATLELGGKKWQQVLAADPDGQALRGRVYEAEHPELGIQVVLTRSGSKYAPVDAPTDRITVEPPYQVARVGDGGGPVPKEYAAFDAVAWNNGPDGKPGTADDVRIGAVPAAWRAEPWDEQARAERDAEFAGKFEDPSVGLFTPGDAGPNPARKYGTNNAGNLKVVATVKDGERELTGEAHLIVTVQRWIHSPIP